jgi:aspartyl-tRNA synthetase
MNRWRDLYCGAVGAEDVGRTVAVAGWVGRRRDHGGLIFIDLRDYTGVLQLVVNPERSAEAAAAAHAIRSEFVVRARGEIVNRAPEAVNPNLATGAVEVQVDELEVVASSTTTASTSPCGCAIATSTSAGTACKATCGCPRPSSPRSAGPWRNRGSSTSGRRR